MSEKEVVSMTTLTASLSKTFGQVPLSAIPAVMDCILSSTGCSPAALFASLLDAFPYLIKDVIKEEGKLDSDEYNHLTSLVGALCHLLKKIEFVCRDNYGALPSFMWRSFLPLVMKLYECEPAMVNQITEAFINVLIETNSWEFVEATLIPFFLRSIGHSMGMPHNEESDIIKWNSCSFPQGSYDSQMDKELLISPSGCYPLSISCHILTSILEGSLQCQQRAPTSESVGENVICYADKFLGNLVWDLCNMSERMLLHSLEHRSTAIAFLLPIIFKSFSSSRSFAVSFHGKTHTLTRDFYFIRMWKCCRTLFSLGPLERRDAYNVLSLYFTLVSCHKECKDTVIIGKIEEYTITEEKEFWDEIKRGLVDKESLVRKQCLQMLKLALQIHGGNHSAISISEMNMSGKPSVPHGMTKREMWAEKEAKSLGVGKLSSSSTASLNSQQYWEAFVLLYEMLEEYGTHLVEAAWKHQVSLLLQFSVSRVNYGRPTNGAHQNQFEASSEIFNWLSILWERGFCHDNPQVRCLIMQSFLDINWKNYENCIKSVPETFVLGPFMQGLNDPIHHKEFGAKGHYLSRTIEGAACFLEQYTSFLDPRSRVVFLSDLASTAKRHSYGRAGLMGLAECIASAAAGGKTHNHTETKLHDTFLGNDQVGFASGMSSQNDTTELLDVLRYVIECSKQHFNPNYRLRVCDKVLDAAASVVCTFDFPLEILLLFISTLPQESTDCFGSLRVKLQKWLLGCGSKLCSANCCSDKMKLWKSLHDFPQRFMARHRLADASCTYDDEDLIAWESEANRWTRLLFLAIREERHLSPILMFIENASVSISKQNNDSEFVPGKFMILTLSLVMELQILWERATERSTKVVEDSDFGLFDHAEAAYENFANKFLFILEGLVSLAKMSCSIFWSGLAVEDTTLPTSVRGKLGGPSQRRLSISTTTTVLQAIMSVKAVASISFFCARLNNNALLNSAIIFMWQFFWRIITSPPCNSETGAEICLAAYEALAPVLRTLVSTFSPYSLDFIRENNKLLSPGVEDKPLLDSLFVSFIQHINNLLAAGVLARSRRAVLLNWKWSCLESLLSIPYHTLKNGLCLEGSYYLFSGDTLRWIFADLVESLENAGESSVLPMLRSIRMAVGLSAKGKSNSIISCCSGVDAQMMWQLVRTSWILHVNCNKRRVAPIAALLSSVLHASVFNDESMHETDNGPGPLKWFVEKVMEEGTKSPRTIRLAALHLTGLWLSNPKTIKYYIKELKLLSLYGSVAFDEDFEAELADNHEARSEVSLLARSPDSELTEAFINTELYARVSVAVMFYKLANLIDMLGSVNQNEDCCAVVESGKLFLLELLDSVVNDKDLSKELYKKYSAIHRRKIRAWQMMCVLSRFVDQDIVGKVVENMHIGLYRNNLPAVRQYLETFAINIYLKFPSLVREQLVPILRDYNMRPQALSSYVFISANVILHSSEVVQHMHLEELFPPLIPLLTSHHHSLRGFTQLLVHQILHKLFPLLNPGAPETLSLEKRCFEDLKSYLANNCDCTRLRHSMEGYLDAYNPKSSVAPAGIFINRVEELEFECVPTSLMEQVLSFLNDVREDLRCSMAKDVVTIRNESLRSNGEPNCIEKLPNGSEGTQLLKDATFDFQKKVTLSKHEKQETDASSFLGNNETYKKLLEMDEEDRLLDQMFQSRRISMERARASQQHFILVASLLDRIPNLAGLARTCEVFRASGLTVADKSVLSDKQFQLISVTAEKWVPVIEVPVNSVKVYLEKKRREGFSILGLEQTANSIPLDEYTFPKKTVLVLGREKEGIPVDIIHILDACVEIPQLGVVRSLNVHVSGAIALWEYTRQQRSH
ncbi:tRNA/rRNA methyltransferase (SpoU) family protein [Quillaja saponaria]|uniref:tRNA (guanosine(18)-2'-O)-methyltransferase TARBP1 n=1 Tax=Quillaja saponaria TaxID=32244 RepID=A0AAD7L6N8_QUISA|nr:tRNA/rRNA methyltransferase (SpoU) family protein [Quillaja saponaria]